MFFQDLIKSKTFWTGVAAIVGALGGMAQGILPVPDGLEIIVVALIGIFLRHSQAKATNGQ